MTHKIVPIEPTGEMIKAAIQSYNQNGKFALVSHYKAMTKNAPELVEVDLYACIKSLEVAEYRLVDDEEYPDFDVVLMYVTCTIQRLKEIQEHGKLYAVKEVRGEEETIRAALGRPQVDVEVCGIECDNIEEVKSVLVGDLTAKCWIEINKGMELSISDIVRIAVNGCIDQGYLNSPKDCDEQSEHDQSAVIRDLAMVCRIALRQDDNLVSKGIKTIIQEALDEHAETIKEAGE